MSGLVVRLVEPEAALAELEAARLAVADTTRLAASEAAILGDTGVTTDSGSEAGGIREAVRLAESEEAGSGTGGSNAAEFRPLARAPVPRSELRVPNSVPREAPVPRSDPWLEPAFPVP